MDTELVRIGARKKISNNVNTPVLMPDLNLNFSPKIDCLNHRAAAQEEMEQVSYANLKDFEICWHKVVVRSQIQIILLQFAVAQIMFAVRFD